MGPTPERVRQLLARVGLLDPWQAFGAAGPQRFGETDAARLRDAAEARLSDQDVLKIWWEKRINGESIPLDRLAIAGQIEERQHMAGMRYARAAWRLIGMPWPHVEAIYRRTGAVPDERAGVMRADPEEAERALERAESDLADAARAVRVRVGEEGLIVLGSVAIYLEDRWVGSTESERERDRCWRLFLRALDAVADALRVRAG